MTAIFWLIDTLLDMYRYILIAWVILSWLLMLQMVNYHNPYVRMISDFLHAVTEPALSRIRRFMPNLGTIDISPIILIFAVIFIQIFIKTSVRPMFLS